MAIRKTIDDLKQEEDDLDARFFSSDARSIEELTAERARVRDARKRYEREYENKWKGLGLVDRAKLDELKGSEFLRLRMNALALKTRLRDYLRERKDEIERLERSYRTAVNGKQYWVYLSTSY